jgi:hypothetical protein
VLAASGEFEKTPLAATTAWEKARDRIGAAHAEEVNAPAKRSQFH